MESVVHLVVAAFKLGLLGCLMIAITIYAAYVIESHCWDPIGCRPTAAQQHQQQENDRIMRCWQHQTGWKECANAH